MESKIDKQDRLIAKLSSVAKNAAKTEMFARKTALGCVEFTDLDDLTMTKKTDGQALYKKLSRCPYLVGITKESGAFLHLCKMPDVCKNVKGYQGERVYVQNEVTALETAKQQEIQMQEAAKILRRIYHANEDDGVAPSKNEEGAAMDTSADETTKLKIKMPPIQQFSDLPIPKKAIAKLTSMFYSLPGKPVIKSVIYNKNTEILVSITNCILSETDFDLLMAEYKFIREVKLSSVFECMYISVNCKKLWMQWT